LNLLRFIGLSLDFLKFSKPGLSPGRVANPSNTNKISIFKTLRKFGNGLHNAIAKRIHSCQCWFCGFAVSADLYNNPNRNTDIRARFESQGLTVTQLQRTQIGKIKLGELKPGR
jgi:hypothetical protein